MAYYPDGKIRPDDEGALAISFYMSGGRLIMDFGKETSWIGFDSKSLDAFINLLQDKRAEMP